MARQPRDATNLRQTAAERSNGLCVLTEADDDLLVMSARDRAQGAGARLIRIAAGLNATHQIAYGARVLPDDSEQRGPGHVVVRDDQLRKGELHDAIGHAPRRQLGARGPATRLERALDGECRRQSSLER